jgi:hypothetical protein
MIIAMCGLLLALTGCVSANTSLEMPAEPPSGMTELQRVELPETLLRGYGSLGGECVEYGSTPADAAVSILLVRCADAVKARIALAKYRSDLRCLKGVTEASVPLQGRQVPLAVVEGQGEIAAACSGSMLVIVAAKQRDALVKALAALKLESANLDVAGTPQVPTYMDKFDRWGFGFWFAQPLGTPEKQEQTYDVREKFEWARKMGVSLQFDLQLNQTGSAEGILDDTGKRWGIELAYRMGIPVFVQMQGAPAPGWIANRYADEMQQKVPQYVGGWYGINGRNGFPGSPLNTLSWASVEGKNRVLADQYQAVHKYKNMPNVTGYGEWHGEVGEDVVAMLMDHGPVADARYRDYLRHKYQMPQKVDQRWSGGHGLIKTWDDVRMPEPADFLGWSERAVDLQGQWRLCEEGKLPVEAKGRWGATDLQDGAWRKLIVPGDDHQLFRENWRVPTIFRRAFDLSDEQLARLKASGKTWLYVLTLQQGETSPLRAVLNDKSLPDQPLNRWASWVVVDVTERLQKGNNLLALSLPWGELSYRVYLSPEAPRCYPDLGKKKNAQWVDYRDFISWMREDGLRRSIEAIRREDPDKFIKIYAPGAITDVMKGLAEDYGCYFHDTGFMSGCWNDSLPSLMRSSGLPMSLEPGGPGQTLPELKRMFGYWMTEGLNTVDYFMDIGDILWRPDQKAWFEARQPLVHLLGKFHYPEAEVAVMAGEHAHRLTGFPWDHFDTPLLWNTRRNGVGTLGRVPDPRDLLNESDFLRGNVNKYKVIVDDATLIMDDALIAKIEQWVRAGGIFITQGQTGRHSPETPDAWLINRLTGYRAVGNNDNGRVSAIAGQPIFTDPAWTQLDKSGWPVVGGAGLYLEKVAPECRDILAWPNKAGIAMGVRPLGKGKVVTMGTPMPNVPTGWVELLKWCGVTVPIAPTAPGCRVAHFVSNNGLYDVYVVSAEQIKEPGAVTLTIPGKQATMVSVLTGAPVSGTVVGDKVEFAGLHVEPLETCAFLAPRRAIISAPLAWLKLQRQWWKGTRKPAPAPELKPRRNTLSLDADWAFAPVPDAWKDADSLIGPGVDDSAWTRMDIGVWYGPKFPATKRGVFRQRFTVPADWNGTGRTWLWIRGASPGTPTLPPHKWRVFLDGQPVTGGEHGYCNEDLTDRLTPGEHTLAVATETRSVIGGIVGNVWLEHVPEPVARQSLAGDWNGMQLPGTAKIPFDQFQREFTLDPAMKGKRALLYIETTENIIPGIFLNGRLMNRDFAGMHSLVDVTPYVQWDQSNRLTLNSLYPQHPTAVKSVEIRYYEPGAY